MKKSALLSKMEIEMPYFKNRDVEFICLFSKELEFCGNTLDVVTDVLESIQNMPDTTC
jgi:hypothetical protein